MRINFSAYFNYRSLVIASMAAYQSCKERFELEGYEVESSIYVRENLAYVFDNEGLMSTIRILSEQELLTTQPT